MASTEVGLSSFGKDRVHNPEGYAARATRTIGLSVVAFKDGYPIVVEEEFESEEWPSGFLPPPAKMEAARIYLSTGHPVPADDRIRTYEIEHPTQQRILNRLHIQGIVYANPSSAASYGWKRDLELFLAPLRDLTRTRQVIQDYMKGEGEKISIRRITVSLGIVVDELVGGRRLLVQDPISVNFDDLFTVQRHPAFIHSLGRDEVGYIRQELGMTRPPVEYDDQGKIQSLTISYIYPFASQNVDFIDFNPPIKGRCDADDAEGYKQFVLDRKPWVPYVTPVTFDNNPAFYAGFPDELYEKTRVFHQRT